MAIDHTAAGAQHVLAGAERVDQGQLARRRAAAPLKPARAQSPCDVGLFSDGAAQSDLLDAIARHERGRTLQGPAACRPGERKETP